MENLKTQNGDATLERLKTLLLDDELQTLDRLKEDVATLSSQCRSPEEIIDRIEPLVTTILRRRFNRPDNELIALLSEYIADIIAQASTQRLPDLSRALRPVIAPTISKEIADNKDTMIDALYPIMGGMIAKYVTQAIKEFTEKVNRKLEEGLSVRAVKRKIKAKLTGVSESELLLEEESDADVLALFVIHKPTGLLITSAQLEQSVINDAHMVAAMASAVKDFLNDSFDFKRHAKEEVQIVSYGDATLYIESAGSVYLVAFLDGEPDYEQRSGINSFFAHIVRHYAPFFQSFDGNEEAPEVARLHDELVRYLDALRQGRHDQKKRSSMFFWVAVLLFVPLLAWFGYVQWKRYQIKRISEAMQHIGVRQVAIEEINATAYRLYGIVDAPQTAIKAKRRIKRMTGAQTIIDDLVPAATALSGLEKADRTLSASYARIVTELERLRHENEALRQAYAKHGARYQEEVSLLTKRLDELQERYRLLDRKLNLPRFIKRDLTAALGASPYYDAKTGGLNFATLHPFEPMQTTIRPEALPVFRHTVQRYVSALCPYRDAIDRIEVAVFSDTDGDAEKNQKLTQQRAGHIVAMIESDAALRQCFDTTVFVPEGYGESRPVMIDGVEDKNASRRIEIFYRLKPFF